MHRRRRTLWALIGCAVVLALARPMPALAIQDSEEKIIRQAMILAGRLGDLAGLLMDTSVGNPDIKQAALEELNMALMALARLIGNPDSREVAAEAVMAVDTALMAVEEFLGGPDTGPLPHIRGALAAAGAAFAKLIRLLSRLPD